MLMKDVAFKCNWNDGTNRRDAEFPGWSAICSPSTMRLNVKRKRPWCSNKRCPCRRAIDGKLAFDDVETTPCYESSLFPRGVFSNGPGKELKQTAPGKMAFFTSKRPDESEETRLVIGAMTIGRISDDEEFSGCQSVVGKMGTIVRLRREEMPLYWEHVALPHGGKPAWDTGLVRYLSQDDTNSLLATLRRRGIDISVLGPRANSVSDSPTTRSNIEDFGGKAGAVTYIDKVLVGERHMFLYSRNSKAAAQVRRRAKGKCEGCGMDVEARYGKDIIEAHHLTAFATLATNATTSLKDLAGLCPSCHQAIHRLSPSSRKPMSLGVFRATIFRCKPQ